MFLKEIGLRINLCQPRRATATIIYYFEGEISKYKSPRPSVDLDIVTGIPVRLQASRASQGTER